VVPEGDTVWLHAKRLNETLGGQTLTGSDFRLPAYATTDLRGSVVREVVSRGKHLLMRLRTEDRGDWTFRSHLRMDGTWRIFKPGERWRGRPTHMIRVVLTTDSAVAVGFHLHDVALVRTDREDDLVGHLGPDLLGPDWDPDEATRRMLADPDHEIGLALMDQRNLAGIGNLYKCELLFLRAVSPWTRVGDVADLLGMVVLAQRLLYDNRERWAQVTTGDPRRGENVYVYQRARFPCRRCGTPIRRATQGVPPVEDRIIFWCPRCQPGPGPEPFSVVE
jgi:endonuclease-8